MRAGTGNSWPPRPFDNRADSETAIRTESSPPTAPEGINDLLVDELRDILHAEKQLTKASQKWRRRHGSTACASASRNI